MSSIIDIEKCNCFALRQAARYLTQLYEQRTARIGITPAQYSILSKLVDRPHLTMAELACEMVMDRTTLLRALKPLRRDKCVTVDRSQNDARTQKLSLTETGVKKLSGAIPAWRLAQDEFEARFGRTRAKLLRAELFGLTDAESLKDIGRQVRRG